MRKGIIYCLLLLASFSAALAQNYDESKVPLYVLPDVLKTTGGKVIRSGEKWEKLRRPEVLRLFEDNIYGRMPVDYDSIRYMLTQDDVPEMDGKAVLKQVTVTVFRNKQSVQINVVLFVPTQPRKPVPVFLLINNRGKDNTDPTRVKKSEFWPAEMVVDSGFAIAAFHVSDLAPDDKETYMTGILEKLYPEQLNMDNGMKAIGAWAWGASRVMDYFETDRDIDAKKVIVVGHSRGGKTSLWAAAQDQRFAACVTNCSGNTGAALARRQFGERISRINTTFPHWFNNNYKQFNDKESALPVDQHMLISLIAPRPVYATNASKDLWADPTGTFLAMKAAEPVYALYNIKPELPKDPPGINTPVIGSHFGYHNREGEHNMTAYDWGNFIRFAKKF
ncbi:prolyl oligopeptidase family serine peptidase [Dyadobacter sp. CY261]|uniref:alpha/beta hydrolase family protein n=1 Tax=Dyadobacter sp. CY261 TaxID=2907203 RepID=UPI001F45F143|nr:alpha/beta fold hydrolase [Dyadobacter sp. CY261]MCF0073488.1 prolyl oligopeptidase family serine peptidase [Dyadobacter sp. CY261]